jgi:hypothetical protein
MDAFIAAIYEAGEPPEILAGGLSNGRRDRFLPDAGGMC